MLTSFSDLQKFVDSAELKSTMVGPCQFLQGKKYALSPGNFANAIKRETAITPSYLTTNPRWISDSFTQIVKLFSEKNAYGSIMALIDYCKKYTSKCMALIIDRVKEDRKKEVPTLDQKALDFLLLAAMHANCPKFAEYLINDCQANINFQTDIYLMSPLTYGIVYSKHANFFKFLKDGVENHALDLRQLDYNGADILFRAVNGFAFDLGKRNATAEEKRDELIYMLENGALVIRGSNKNALSEAFRIAPQEAPLLLQYGAGLVKSEFRAEHNGKEYSTMEDELFGFNYQQCCNADVVLVGTNKENQQLVWLYGIESVKQALTDPTIEFNLDQIIQQLSLANPEDLGSPELLELLKNAAAPKAPEAAASSSYSCVIC